MPSNRPSSPRVLALASAIAMAVVSTMLALTGTAVAREKSVVLNGDWAPFNRCPVDSPTMLAADGQNSIALCAALESPGILRIHGVTIVKTEQSNTQFGAYVNLNGGGRTEATLVAPPGGVTIDTPGQVTEGLRGLICSTGSTLGACKAGALEGELNDASATLENAGNPTVVDLPAGFFTEIPIVTLKYKLHLENPKLGRNCYIGSDTEPIVVHSENLTSPTSLRLDLFDGNGTPDEEHATLERYVIHGAVQGDTGVAIPAARGCGRVYDNAINAKLGLPSPSGENATLLIGVRSYLAGELHPSELPLPDGQQFAKDWHSAVL